MASFTFDSGSDRAPSDERILWIWAAVALWIAYALVFAGTEGTRLGRALQDGAANVAPLVVLVLACRVLLPRFVRGRPLATQGAVHAVGGLAFSICWYSCVAVLLAVARWLDGSGFQVIGFTGPALTWQMLQGAIIYCAAAAIILRPSVPSAGNQSSKALERYLIRDGEDLRPIEVAEIVTIRGAEYYSEVSTVSGQHLVRMTLADFTGRLDPDQFIRVHRSAILHLRQLDRLEPAGGGRMLAHMRNGEIIAVSRTGARALRQLVV